VQRIAYLEAEVDKLQRTLKDCEEALSMANNETDKSNRVARDAKAKVAELEARVQDLEGEVQAAGAKAAELEMKLKKADEKYAEVEMEMKQYKSKVGQVQQTNVKYEKDLEGVQAGLQDRDMKVGDLRSELTDKDALLGEKESTIGDLSDKVRHGSDNRTCVFLAYFMLLTNFIIRKVYNTLQPRITSDVFCQYKCRLSTSSLAQFQLSRGCRNLILELVNWNRRLQVYSRSFRRLEVPRIRLRLALRSTRRSLKALWSGLTSLPMR
jgi:hypothetical protein